MYSLDVIVSSNRRAARQKPAENAFTRHSSFAGSAERGVVLHSASWRSTVFLKPSSARLFLARYHHNRSVSYRDSLIESYFG